MAPGVKQGVEGLRKLSVEDYRRSVRVSMQPWQTPPLPALSLGDVTYVRRDLHDAAVNDLKRVVRKWEINFLLVCAQFLVVLIAAVWGWAR